MANSKKYWRGVEELKNDADITEASEKEFNEYAPVTEFLKEGKELANTSTSRRDFLKFLGFSTAAATLAACETPVIKSIPYVVKPEEVTPGIANWYASTFANGNDYASILVKTREGRPILIQGNELCPISKGGVNARINASVLSLYNTNRLKNPMMGGAESTWEAVDKAIASALEKVIAKSGQVRFLTNSILSPTTKKLVGEFAGKVGNFKHVTYDAISYSGMLEANNKAFGKKVIPSYNFDKAKVIVSVGADFLGTWLNDVANTKQYIVNRNPDGEWMSKHYQFETVLTITGSKADVRVPVKPSEQGAVLAALFNKISGQSSGTEYSATIDKAAKDLMDNKGASLVVAGSNDENVQMIVNAINEKLGNYGKTVDINTADYLKQGTDAEFAALVKEMKEGKVDALFISGVDPSYSYPGFAEALAKVGTSVSFATMPSKTAEGCKFVCPDNHYLESWNDAMPKDGHYSICQPVISKLFNTRQMQDSLLKWTGNTKDFYTYLQESWSTDIFPTTGGISFTDFWNKSVHDGVVKAGMMATTEAPISQTEPLTEGEVAAATVTGVSAYVSQAIAAVGKAKSDGWEIELYQKVGIGDGADAANPWLQELPDAISKVTWDNYITMSLADVKEMGLNDKIGQEWPASTVTVTANGVTLENVPVYPQPGQKSGSVGLALGYGQNVWKQQEPVGFNAYPMVATKDGKVAYNTSVTIQADGGTYALAATQIHHTIMDRDSVVKETDINTYKTAEKDVYNPIHALAAHEGGENIKKPVSEFDLWEAHPVENVGHRWGMAIDLNACTGCGACVTACHLENNVPVVGKDEVRRGRDMHWMRIDRYYSSDTTKESGAEAGLGGIATYSAMEIPSDNPEVVFQPMMCQHCNHAPCETVCPVAATTHSNEGINQMTYNRCIGTRYCANNCPYKVRRFNWFNYMGYDKFEDINPSQDDLGRMVLNPDVTVRARGVMEKCSLCVQRIQEGKLNAKKDGRKVKDGEIQTACASACPSNAITFGDLNDKETQAAKKSAHNRAYKVIEEVGTQPNMSYLLLVRNK